MKSLLQRDRRKTLPAIEPVTATMQLSPATGSLTKEERDRMTPAQVIEEFKMGNYSSSWVSKFERM
jgi:hypothetical protein